MTKRLETAVPGLDAILEGGLLYHNSVLIKGQPGCGKTTLGIQIVYNGAALFNEPGIIVLFEQFPQQLHRDLESYNWDVKGMTEQKKLIVLFPPATDLLSTPYMEESPLISNIIDAATNLGARRILVDGMTHFLKVLDSDANEREVYLKFLNALKSVGLTPILTAEGSPNDKNTGYEDFLSDCVIHLSNEAAHDTSFIMRQLSVQKTRGHGHIRGKHPYRISEKGIEVFPNIAPRLRDDSAQQQDSTELIRIPSGVDGLDNMLGGGFTKGTASIVAGMPGTFKTTLGAEFAAAGAKQDETSLILSLNENPRFLMQTMHAKGIELQPLVETGKLKILHFFPKHFYMEEFLQQVEQELASNGTARVVVDGVNELERSIEDPAACKDYLTRFLVALRNCGATSLFIQKLDRFTSSAPLTDIEYAALFDGIIYTATVEIESSVHKVISILKMRGSAYQTDLRELTCGAQGLQIRNKFHGISGILSGNVQGQYKKTIEEVFQPLYFVRDFLSMVASPDIDDAQRQEMTQSMSREISKLIDHLGKYFDVEKP
ncbi:hypothetical protein JXA32_15275 [Candidatus Sumerlaeota bacterium]|nr:hypothetical protein [Candidatus Sumerlaeota bacterium]